MPNAENVGSPINIHGIGRSGTTVLQNILYATGFIQVCNETGPFVFSCYRGGELLNASADKQLPGRPGDYLMAVRATHAALCSTLPSQKPSWCQKLGGIPNSVVWNMVTERDDAYSTQPYPFPYEWYWAVIERAFPLGKNVLLLRDFKDVVISRVKLSGYSPLDVAADIGVYFKILAHPLAKIDTIIQFRDLVGAPETTVLRLFQQLGLDYKGEYLKVLDQYAVPAEGSGLEERRSASFSWHEEYMKLAKPLRTAIDAIVSPGLERLKQRWNLD